jgi:hypothetical protein
MCVVADGRCTWPRPQTRAARPEAAAAAASALVGMASDSAALAAPYMVQAGWGDVSAAWAAAGSPAPGVVAGGSGAQQLAAPLLVGDELRVANSSISRAVPPGMVERARQFAVAAQLQLAAGLDAAAAAGRLKVRLAGCLAWGRL